MYHANLTSMLLHQMNRIDMDQKMMPSIGIVNSKMSHNVQALFIVFVAKYTPIQLLKYLLLYQMHIITKTKENPCIESNFMIKQL